MQDTNPSSEDQKSSGALQLPSLLTTRRKRPGIFGRTVEASHFPRLLSPTFYANTQREVGEILAESKTKATLNDALYEVCDGVYSLWSRQECRRLISI